MSLWNARLSGAVSTKHVFAQHRRDSVDPCQVLRRGYLPDFARRVAGKQKGGLIEEIAISALGRWKSGRDGDFSIGAPPPELRRRWSRSADLVDPRLHQLWLVMGAPACGVGPFRLSRNSARSPWAWSIIACNRALHRIGPRRGHGRPSRSPRRRPVVLCGLSLGGMVALQTAIDQPNHVASIIVANSRSSFTGPENTAMVDAWIDLFLQEDGPLKRLRATWPIARQRRIPRERSRARSVRCLGAWFWRRSKALRFATLLRHDAVRPARTLGRDPARRLS